jgi:hypothetical protein
MQCSGFSRIFFLPRALADLPARPPASAGYRLPRDEPPAGWSESIEPDLLKLRDGRESLGESDGVIVRVGPEGLVRMVRPWEADSSREMLLGSMRGAEGWRLSSLNEVIRAAGSAGTIRAGSGVGLAKVRAGLAGLSSTLGTLRCASRPGR